MIRIGLCLALLSALSPAYGGKLVCKKEFQTIRDPDDCAVWYKCSFGRLIRFHPCSSGFVFSLGLGACVPKGSTWDDCIESGKKPKTVEERCQEGQEIIPHPTECALFYNCSLKYVHVPHFFEQHMDECPYPQLLSLTTRKCEPYQHVHCGIRKERKYACEYRKNMCGGPHCIPCSQQYGNCVGKTDGVHSWESRLWTPYFITCYNERSLAVSHCSNVDGVYYLFHPEKNECVSQYKIPKSKGGSMPTCKGEKDGFYPDEDGRCEFYFHCHQEVFTMYLKCPKGFVFDISERSCQEKKNVCSPCGFRTNCYDKPPRRKLC